MLQFVPLIIVILAFPIGLILWKANQFQWQIKMEMDTLMANCGQQPARMITPADYAHLPEPVQRHLRHALPANPQTVCCVRLTQTGAMRLGPDKPWFPFNATQVFTTDRIGFIWRARMRMLPGLWVDVRDKYTADGGRMTIKPLGAFAIGDESGPHISQGALIRYLAEMIWFPAAMLNPALQWHAINNHSASVSAQHDGQSVCITLEFNTDGDITHIISQDRYMNVHDPAPTPWHGYCKAYRTFNGVRIPSQIEVGWEPASGYYTWWRGTVTSMEYGA